MTQLEDAKNGRTTDAMKRVAADEGISHEEVRERVAKGIVVIPKNNNRDFDVKGIGKGLKTKVNANLGTSLSHFDLDEELAKLEVAIDSGADAVMDLSTGGDLRTSIPCSSGRMTRTPISRSFARGSTSFSTSLSAILYGIWIC